MACFLTIIQLLIHSLASFGVTVSKCGIEFESKLKDWINRYLIETWHRLFQGCFKSYRIALGWLYGLILANYPVTYSFIGVFFELRYQNVAWHLIRNLKDWIIRYLIQTYHRLFQEYFKSYRIAFRVSLWLDFQQLSSYLFVYRRLFELRYEIMLHGIWYEIWRLNQKILYSNLPQVISRVFQVI